MQTNVLQGDLLDYWVARAEGYDPVRQRESAEGDRTVINKYRDIDGSLVSVPMWTFRPSTNWALGGPIIEREKIGIQNRGQLWDARCGDMGPRRWAETALIAAMRAYVSSKFGDTVPDEAKV